MENRVASSAVCVTDFAVLFRNKGPFSYKFLFKQIYSQLKDAATVAKFWIVAL
jgi:hypothetical protein